MIITRTPFRISFFGGGTDHPEWYREHGGKVLSATINKYCYVSCRYLPPFFPHKYRIVYSKTECVKTVDEIEHPVVKECIKYLGITKGLGVHYDADLPANSGLGTSSAFTVGLLNALHSLTESRIYSKRQFMKQAIEIERDKVKDVVGSQDQAAAAQGGFNRIKFTKNGSIIFYPVEPGRLSDWCMLFFTGFTRIASKIEAEKIRLFKTKESVLKEMMAMVDVGRDLLQRHKMTEFGKLLDIAWEHKKSLSQMVSNPTIDAIYEEAKKAGAIGGKLLGAGNGGMMLLIVKKEDRPRVREKLKNLLEIPFKFENTGSEVIYPVSCYSCYYD